MPHTFAWKNHGSEFTLAGLPDIVVCHRGLFIALEVKMPGKQDNVSPVQQVVHQQLREAGGRVHVVSSIAAAVLAIQTLPH
jgi:hypothetical protein